MTHQIIDEVLSENDFSYMEKLFLGDDFPWYFGNYTTSNTRKEDLELVKDYKFHHVLYRNYSPTSSLISTIDPIIKFLDPVTLLTCRLFLTTYTGEKVNHGFHTDYESNSNNKSEEYKYLKTAIFYVNTNNGGTLFEDGTFVESIKNRLLLFNASQRHAAITATDVPSRVVLNINYF